ncbi:MAG: LysE family translocator [Rhodoferax sp.]
MNSAEWTALLVLCTAVSFTPGPNTTLSTALAVNAGLRTALRFVLAVPVGWALLIVLCAAGLGTLVLQLPALRWAIKALGVGYLLWLALRLVRTRALSATQPALLSVSFKQGVLVQALNIKAWMLALTVASGWIAGRDDAAARLTQVLPVLMTFALASNLLYALLGTALRRWLADVAHGGRRLRVFNAAMAALLVATAAWMLTA